MRPQLTFEACYFQALSQFATQANAYIMMPTGADPVDTYWTDIKPYFTSGTSFSIYHSHVDCVVIGGDRQALLIQGHSNSLPCRPTSCLQRRTHQLSLVAHCLAARCQRGAAVDVRVSGETVPSRSRRATSGRLTNAMSCMKDVDRRRYGLLGSGC